MRLSFVQTLRGRLLVLALLVEAVMLGFLIANSLRLVRDNMGEMARTHAEQIAPVLRAALVAPMAQFDYATVQAVLDESEAVKAIEYIAVTDRSGQVVAISGWPLGKPLPEPDREFVIDSDEQPPRFDVSHPILLAGQQLGTLHFGVDLSQIIAARRSLLFQGFFIAGTELVLSACLLAILGLIITRQLSVLTRASTEVAKGASPPQVPEGSDDIGQLGAAFNAMSRAVEERLTQLTQARDEMATMASAMEHEHARLAALLAAMDFGILFSGQDDEVVYANAAFGRQWGLAAHCCQPGVARPALFERLAQSVVQPADFARLAGDFTVGGSELQLADGRVIDLHQRPVRGEGGEEIGHLWLCRDITEERQAARQLLEAKEKAEAASTAKSQFLAVMSHEIRTPLNGILGMAQLLKLHEITPEEQADCVATILRSGQTLLTLLNDLLDLSKVEAGKIVLESIEVDPARLLADTQALFGESAHAKGLQLETAWHGEARCYRADPTRLRQMLNNLVSNAIKFTDHGSVRVEARPVGQGGEAAGLEFSVSDTGIGISAEQQAKLFKPFSQADATTTRRFGGTGLGLSIVRSLARLMGGEAGVRSQPGAGATFWFRIAAQPVSGEPPAGRGDDPAAARPLQGIRAVLLVDDNATNRKVVEMMLRKQGLDVACAENGQQAIDLLAESAGFDLVLMDCQMPVLDGLAATREIRRRESEAGAPRRPVVALTAGAYDDDRRECFAAGMDDFLAKPVHLDDLVAMLAKWSPPADADAEMADTAAG